MASEREDVLSQAQAVKVEADARATRVRAGLRGMGLPGVVVREGQPDPFVTPAAINDRLRMVKEYADGELTKLRRRWARAAPGEPEPDALREWTP